MTATTTIRTTKGDLTGKVTASYATLFGRSILKVESGGRRHLAIGDRLQVVIGESVTLSGRWTHHDGAGRCFLVDARGTVRPADIGHASQMIAEGLRVDFQTATQLLATHGDGLFGLLDANGATALVACGLSTSEAREALENWQRFRARQQGQELMNRLHLSEAQQQQLQEVLGTETELSTQLRDNPYIAPLHLDGLDWSDFVTVGKELGVLPDDQIRIQAGVMNAVRDAGRSGHTFLPVAMLHQRTERQLEAKLPRAAFDTAINALRKSRLLSFHDDRVYAPDNFTAANLAAQAVRTLQHATSDLDPPESYAAASEVLSRPDYQLRRQRFDLLQRCIERAVSFVDTRGYDAQLELADEFMRIGAALLFRVAVIVPTLWAVEVLSKRGSPGSMVGTALQLLGEGATPGQPDFDALASLEADVLVVCGAEQMALDAMQLTLTRRQPGSAVVLIGDTAMDVGFVPGRAFMDFCQSPPSDAAQWPVEVAEESGSASSPLDAYQRLLVSPDRLPQLVGRFDLPVSVLPMPIGGSADEVVARYVAEVLPRLLGRAPEVADIAVVRTRNEGRWSVTAFNERLRALLNPDATQVVHVGRTRLTPGDPISISVALTSPEHIPAGTPLVAQGIHGRRGPVAAQYGAQRIDITGDMVDSISCAYVRSPPFVIWQRFDTVIALLPEGKDPPNASRLLYSLCATAASRVVFVGALERIRSALVTEKRPPHSLLRLLLASPDPATPGDRAS